VIARKFADPYFIFLFERSVFLISATVVIHAIRRNKIQGTPITSFSVRPFRRWRERSCGAFWKSFFSLSPQLPRRRTDRNQNAQRTINHCIPKRNSYAVTSIEMRPLKPDRSLSRSPKSSRIPSGLASCDERMAVHQRNREFVFSDKSTNAESQKFLTKREGGKKCWRTNSRRRKI